MFVIYFLIAISLCIFVDLILDLKFEKRKKTLIFFVVIYLFLLAIHFGYGTMRSVGKTLDANRHGRLLAEVLESMDVSENGDSELLKKQVRYLQSKANIILHDEMEFAALVDWMRDSTNHDQTEISPVNASQGSEK
ncbi:MAG: hypothetical protein JJU29_18415 [Verrucomicrobia bacterium]|nr:hypothetical protein [Verrucomicrobiota bacterium]MCH8513955.1 hypothetical protein [Kiritimatiellia bacterium]